jgi:septum formation protein
MWDMLAPPARVVLASRSPRRIDLLRQLGLEPEVVPAALAEETLPGEPPSRAALRLARAKAVQVAANLGGPGLVVAADTVVEVDGQGLGKPTGAGDARRMLGLLSGRVHQVHTGVAVIDLERRRQVSGVSSTDVEVAVLDDADLDWYLSTGESIDKAGAYAVQGRAALFIRGLRGSYDNVVGLPLALLHRLCLELGFDLRRAGKPA